jgi:cation diffusion facilitator family transporter
MINILRKVFIKDYDNLNDSKVREKHGKLASFVGIFSNLVLFIIKLIAGLLTASVAIIADSVNNLSDMGSSVITLIGFKLAGMPADEEHPYGHQRLEYIAGLIVALIVIFVGISLFSTSIDKIFNYVPVEINKVFLYISSGILLVSILIKLWQSLFNKKMGKLISSVALEATAQDSRNDCISTGVVLLGNIVLLIFGNLSFSLDGILGILVSVFIIVAGANLIKDTIDPLIGVSTDSSLIADVIKDIKSNEVVLGVHDVMCHMYGPTKMFMTIHCEVDCKGDIIVIHDHIDNIENEIMNKYGVLLTIHMDPLDIHDEEANKLKEEIKAIVNDIDDNLDIHDFRVVRKLSKSTILFDIVVPYNFKLSNDELTNKIEEEFFKNHSDYVFLIHFDNIYVTRS